MSSWKITNKKVNQIGLKRCKVRLPFWFRSNSSNKFYPRSGIECNFHMLKLQENKNKKVHNKIWQQLGQKALHMGRAIAWFHVGHAPSLFGGSSYNVWTPGFLGSDNLSKFIFYFYWSHATRRSPTLFWKKFQIS